jgi:5'(3')-deoxyribonucleotidase
MLMVDGDDERKEMNDERYERSRKWKSSEKLMEAISKAV